MEHKIICGMGGNIHYWVSRPKGTPKGTLVFTHGLTANHTMFEKQVEFFHNEYVIVVWDVPMHGLSMPYHDFSHETTAKELNHLLIQEGIEKACLVGMSMGGYPSQMFAALFPEKVQCFIGLDTTPFGTEYYSKSDLWWLSKVKPIANCFTDKLLRKSIARSISTTEYSYRKMMEILEPLTKEQIIEQMDIAYGKFAEENRNLHLDCPVLILLGEKDKTGKVKQYCKQWAKTKGYPLHIIKNAAHFSNGDNSEQVNLEIEKFLKEIDTE